MVEIGKSVQWA